jgi:membrane protein YqaA with SNARE-associated domain
VTVETILAAVGLYAGSFVIGALSCIVPVISIEVFLVAIAIMQPGGPLSLPAVLAIIALATTGQVVGKLPVYYAVRGLAGRPGRHRKHVERAQRWMARLRARPTVVLAASALLGLPPFSLASTAAGALGIPPRTFCVVIAVSRALRFAILIAIAAHTRG